MDAYTHGEGPTKVLAVHGWLGTAGQWQQTTQWLDPTRYTISMPDHRGYGTRLGESGAFSLQEIADDAFALADELNWAEFDVIGHSMGGKIAQLMLSMQPERVTRMVGVNPVPPGALPFDDETRAFFAAAADDVQLRAAIIRNTTGDRYSATFADVLAAESARQSDPKAVRRYFEEWSGTDISHQVKGLQTPFLVLAGEHDASLSAQVLEQAILPFYPNAVLDVISASGHYPIFETPAALATAIDGFLGAGRDSEAGTA